MLGRRPLVLHRLRRVLALGWGPLLVVSLSLVFGVVTAGPAQAIDVGCPAAAGSYAGGSGVGGDPYQVATPAQLQLLRNDSFNWDDSFIVTSDIDMCQCRCPT